MSEQSSYFNPNCYFQCMDSSTNYSIMDEFVKSFIIINYNNKIFFFFFLAHEPCVHYFLSVVGLGWVVTFGVDLNLSPGIAVMTQYH